MMSTSAHLLAAIYPDQEHAQVILDMLERMHRADTITLVDSALITKNDKGKLQTQETKELTTKKGARRGAIIMGSLGLLFPPTIIAAAVTGGAIGAIAGKLRDSGIKNKQLRELAERLEPGKAIVVALAADDSLASVQTALAGYEGELVVAAIDEETLTEFHRAAAMKYGAG